MMRRYAEYRESGNNWFPTIPSNWPVRKLSHVVTEISSGTTPNTANTEYYDEGTVAWVNTGDLNDGLLIDCAKRVTEKAIADHTPLRVYPRGSVVIALYGATIGRLAILDFDACVNQACCVLRPNNNVSSQFIFYWLMGFREHIITLATGGGQPNISQEIVCQLRLPFPPLPEQTAIAAFLDVQTAAIDGLIQQQRRLIALLREKRQAVISHAVTRGLNPKAPLKPSGIDWLGDVPEGWEVKRLSHVCDFSQGKAHEPFFDDDGEYICVTARFVSTNGEKFKRCSANLTPAQKGDILMVMSDLPNGRALARVFLVKDAELLAVNQRVCKITVRRGDFRYFAYQLDRNNSLLAEDDGVNQTHLSNSSFTKLSLVVPPDLEQKEIADYLDKTTAQFDTLTATAESAIALLVERRAALISAAVTGKIDVRDFVSQHAEVEV